MELLILRWGLAFLLQVARFVALPLENRSVNHSGAIIYGVCATAVHDCYIRLFSVEMLIWVRLHGVRYVDVAMACDNRAKPNKVSLQFIRTGEKMQQL